MLQAFADLSFRWKITLPILLLLVLLALLGGLGVQGLNQVVDSSARLTNRYLPAVSLLLNADRDLYQAFTAERSLLDESSGDFVPSSSPTMPRTSSRPTTGCTSTPTSSQATRLANWWPASTVGLPSGRPPR